VALFICAIFPIQTLASDCQQESDYRHNSLDITVAYSADGKDQLLQLQYNVSERTVTHSELMPPAEAPQEKRTWVERLVERDRVKTEQLCSGTRVSRFHLLADEVEQALRDVHHKASHTPSMRVSPHTSDDHGYERLRHQLNRLIIREICRYEFGAAILYIVFIAAVAILEIFTMLWYTFQVHDRAKKEKPLGGK
jgi:hypothetical protein